MRIIFKTSLWFLAEKKYICILLRRRNLSLSLIAAITNYLFTRKAIEKCFVSREREPIVQQWERQRASTARIIGRKNRRAREKREEKKVRTKEEKEKETRKGSEDVRYIMWWKERCGGIVRGLEMWMFRNLAHTGVRSFRFWVTTAWPCGPSGSKPPPRDEDVRPAPLRDDRAHSFPPELTLR